MARPGPNLPSVSKLVLKYTTTAAGVTAINVIHVLSGGSAGLDVFNRFVTAWNSVNMAHTTPDVHLTQVDVTRLDNLSATESFVPTGPNFTGTTAGDLVPSLSLLVKFTTGFRGLASQGRLFAPFVAEANNANGKYLDTAYQATQDGWVAFVNSLTTQSIPLQIVSAGRFDADDTQTAPAINHTVTAVAVNPALATIRPRQSRLLG